MKLLRRLIFLFLIISSIDIPLQAQDKLISDIRIKTDIAQFFMMTRRTVLMSVELETQNRWGLQFDYGHKLNILPSDQTDQKVQRFHIEIRRYTKWEKNRSFYFGIANDYIWETYNHNGGGTYTYINREGMPINYDTAKVERNQQGLLFTCGIRRRWEKRLGMEFGLGMGGRIVDLKYLTLNEMPADSVPNGSIFGGNKRITEGKVYRYHMWFNIKITYQLLKRDA